MSNGNGNKFNIREIIDKWLEDINKHPLFTTLGLASTIALVIIAFKDFETAKNDYEFEREQRAAELLFISNTSIAEHFSSGTRLKWNRFIHALEQLEDDDEQKDFMMAFIEPSNLYEPNKSILENTNILKLFELEKPQSKELPKEFVTKFVTELSEYRAALLLGLNTMEAIATMRCVIKSDEADKIIDSRYQGVMTKTKKSLQPFIELYRKVIYFDKQIDYIAWNMIDTFPDLSQDLSPAQDTEDKCNVQSS